MRLLSKLKRWSHRGAFLLLIILLVTLLGCSLDLFVDGEQVRISIEESEVNFAEYEQVISGILAQYGYEMHLSDRSDQRRGYQPFFEQRYYIEIDERRELQIILRNRLEIESISVSQSNWMLSKDEKCLQLDLDLLLEIFNTFSEEELMLDEIESFLHTRSSHYEVSPSWRICHEKNI